MRESDGEVFTIGDHFVTDTQIKGQITGFDLLENTVFVNHTWSGVGVSLEMLRKVTPTPSKHQIGDQVKFLIAQEDLPGSYRACCLIATVKSVHFYAGKVKYDLELPIAGESPTRIYNIDSCFVVKPEEGREFRTH
jgi:hypothetical protein